MVVLCFLETGDDYLHVAKRFGIIAAANFPLHFMLGMKSGYSPLAFVFNASHEQIIPFHRMSGRILYCLLLTHAIWYINYFYQSNRLDHLTSRHSLTGIVSFTLMTILTAASLERVRNWSFRVFYNIHLILGLSMFPILFFHAKALRVYAVESILIFIVDRVLRKIDTVTVKSATISKIPHTDLVKLHIPVSGSKLAQFQKLPAQHVYLSLPRGVKSSAPFINSLISNPFTVANVEEHAVTLVLRARNGPTTKALSTLSDSLKANTPISIEGPYGSSSRFTTLATQFDRILLIAGGVGGTFILPIYHALRDQFETEGRSPHRLNLTWSIRTPAEVGWAIDPEDGKSFIQNQNANVHVTRDRSSDDLSTLAGDELEMDELQPFNGGEELIGAKKGRPDLRAIVEETFSDGDESVAVVFCGPKDMGRDVRGYIGKWVKRGRYVWWHEESFGW
ncbi:hypothetical protein AWENTII_012075 [Aspergillus wentii]